MILLLFFYSLAAFNKILISLFEISALKCFGRKPCISLFGLRLVSKKTRFAIDKELLADLSFLSLPVVLS